MHEKTAYHNLVLGSISASSGRHSELIGDLRYYAALSPNDSAKVQEDYEKATMGFSIISGLTLSYSTSFLSAFIPHINKLKAKIYFFLLSLCMHILNAQKLLIQIKKKRKINMHLNLVYVSQLHPQICIRAGPNDYCRWRRHGSLKASFYAGCVCACVRACASVCVRQTRGAKPENTISLSQVFHTPLPSHSARPAVCTLRAALLHDPNRWSGNLALLSCTKHIPQHWWKVPLLRFYITLIYHLFLKKYKCILLCTLWSIFFFGAPSILALALRCDGEV